jgi:hypothetical protein
MDHLKPDAMISFGKVAGDLEGGFVSIPGVAGGRAQGLPISAYTDGDTQAETSPLPDSTLASLPNRVLRRYSPVTSEQALPGLSNSPLFDIVVNEDLPLNIEYPYAQRKQGYSFEAVLDVLSGNQKNNQMAHAEAFSEFENSFVETDPEVFELLQTMNLEIPKEVRLSYLRTKTSNRNDDKHIESTGRYSNSVEALSRVNTKKTKKAVKPLYASAPNYRAAEDIKKKNL